MSPDGTYMRLMIHFLCLFSWCWWLFCLILHSCFSHSVLTLFNIFVKKLNFLSKTSLSLLNVSCLPLVTLGTNSLVSGEYQQPISHNSSCAPPITWHCAILIVFTGDYTLIYLIIINRWQVFFHTAATFFIPGVCTWLLFLLTPFIPTASSPASPAQFISH